MVIRTTRAPSRFTINREVYPYIFLTIISFSVIQALVALIHEPEPEHPLRSELAKEFMEDKAKFIKNAKDFTSKFAESRN